MLDETAIQQRLPVWHALSDIFLDTELQPADHARIADALRASPFSPAELRAILEREVAPAFAFNLLSVAGEWTSWSSEEVRAIMLRSLGSPGAHPLLIWARRMLNRRVAAIGKGHVAAEWGRIAALLSNPPS